MSRTRIAALTLVWMVVAATAFGQDFRGSGTLTGKVVDDKGKGIEGVVVTASYPAVLGAKLQVATDKDGNWVVEGVGEGGWEFVFEKDGYLPGKGSAEVDENGRSRALRTTLKKAFDPNEFIQQEGKKAEAMMAQKNYAGARAVYEGIIAKVPEVSVQMQPFLGRTYYLEGKNDKAVEHLKAGLAKDTGNMPARLLLLEVLLQMGSTDEAAEALKAVPDNQLTEPTLYQSFGLALLKKQKAVEAVTYFDKAVNKFPKAGESYYYRANALVELVNAQKDPKDPERIKRIEQIKSDLNRFLQLSPGSPDAENAKKLLEQIAKLTAE